MSLQTALIDFQSSKLLTAYDENTGKIYVALKPLVAGMGLDFASQNEKIKNDSRFNCRVIPMVGADGKKREMVALAVDHLPAFLYSINPNRVKKELRSKIIAFQRETFAVINAYWRKKTRQAHASPARIGELEQRIYMLKRENTELKRAINRLTYNQKHSEDKRKIFIDDNGNAIDLIKLWNRGVFPYIPEAAKELREKIAKELGSVGHVYQAKLLEIERLFSAKPLRIGNGVIVGSVMFPDALLESRPEKDMPVIGR